MPLLLFAFVALRSLPYKLGWMGGWVVGECVWSSCRKRIPTLFLTLFFSFLFPLAISHSFCLLPFFSSFFLLSTLSTNTLEPITQQPFFTSPLTHSLLNFPTPSRPSRPSLASTLLPPSSRLFTLHSSLSTIKAPDHASITADNL